MPEMSGGAISLDGTIGQMTRTELQSYIKLKHVGVNMGCQRVPGTLASWLGLPGWGLAGLAGLAGPLGVRLRGGLAPTGAGLLQLARPCTFDEHGSALCSTLSTLRTSSQGWFS